MNNLELQEGIRSALKMLNQAYVNDVFDDEEIERLENLVGIKTEDDWSAFYGYDKDSQE